jgi:hypothetical protein
MKHSPGFLPARGMEFPQMFSAQEAKKLVQDAHSLDGEYKRTETIAILNNIKEAAGKGLSIITVSNTDGIIEARLKNLGYQTLINYDQRDGDYMTISW